MAFSEQHLPEFFTPEDQDMRLLAAAFAATLTATLLLPPSANAQSRDYEVGGSSPFATLFRYGGGGPGPIPRTLVDLRTNYKPGSIIVDTRARRLYLVLGNGEALAYGIGVGRDGFRFAGAHRVSMKREWPDWTPPAQMLKRRPDLPRHMKGGPGNPLGARALYLGSTLYRIHGTDEPETIGQAVSSGCFRMVNEDVVDLYNRVQVGAMVYVKN